jgi:FkbM family methyltransferase
MPDLMADFEIDLHGQDAEVHLLAGFLARLENAIVVDVGAELGSVAHVLLGAGATEVHLIEPVPGNVAVLRQRFVGDGRVRIHEIAASAADGELVLHLSTTPSGEVIPFGHTALERPDTAQIAWRDAVTVPARSLASLAEAGTLPARVGIVKIDTEGNDLAVVHGLGDIDCDVVMVEHWTDLGDSIGPCPWTAEAMTSALRERGFRHFALVLHHGEFTTLRWDDATIDPGEMGNIVFLHDRVVDRLLPDVLVCASALSAQTAEFAQSRAAAAAERLTAIDELTARQAVLAEAADERLAALEALREERERVAAIAAERLEVLERMTSEIDDLRRTSEERLRLIGDLERERDLQAKAAAERLAALEALREEREHGPAEGAEALQQMASEIDELRRTSEERLRLIDELERERDLQAKAAAERLEALDQLEREATIRQRALEELAAQRHYP